MADIILEFILFFIVVAGSAVVGCVLGNMIGSCLIKWFR